MDRRRAAGALLALAACIACSAAAPTASNHTALDLYEGAPEGCYYNFQHYGEGDRIMTNEPCLNCTCHNRMLMCYLRVCPFTKPIGQDCTVEKRADQCCPIVTCPDVPVDLLTSTSTTSPAEYGSTGLGKLDKYGCSMNGKYFPEGAKVPPTPNKPCEHCYCIRNMTTCVMQECTLHVDGCTPIYHKDVCCPVRYSCDHPEDEVPLLDDMSTTVRPTPGFLLTTTTVSPVTQMTQDCVHNDQVIADGASITTEKACEHCYCMKGDIVCVVQECGAPMENEGKNCTSLPPREGQCCPDTYICEGDDLSTEISTDSTTDSILEKLTTLSPPRRGGVEGSGYRIEPSEAAYTETPTVESELEGSGEELEPTKPTDSYEPFVSGKPLKPEQITPEPEDAEQYIPVTTKAPFVEKLQTTTHSIDRNVIPDDMQEQETVEPDNYQPTTRSPVQEQDKITTGLTDDDHLRPQEQVTVAGTSVPESYEKVTTESGESLNTVPDITPEQEHEKPHEYDHSTTSTISSIDEIRPTVPQEIETTKETPLDTEQDATKSSTAEGITESGPLTPGSGVSDDIKSETTEKSIAEPELVTEKESIEPGSYTDSTTVAPTVEESGPYAPIESEGEKESLKPELDVPSTTSSPVAEIEKFTTEPDHAQNTVAVNEEGYVYPRPSSEEAEKSTPSDEGVSATERVTKDDILEPHTYSSTPTSVQEESEITTAEPDKGLNTIPSEIDEESSSLPSVTDKTDLSSETKSTEPSVIIDATKPQEIESPTTSESVTSSSESHVTKADQYTVTTEPSFRREDEASVTTEKPKEDLASTTIKPEFVDEGLIPTSTHDDKLSTGSEISAMDEDITTVVPEYIEETVESKKPTTESSVVSESLPEKITQTITEQESELTSSTEKVADVTVSTPEIDLNEEPSRIPGEGDCLLNGVTYRNNTVVPSSNNCHTSCKCASSIVKCDPIICMPPPDYMDNCQSIYDTPDSCCPTYVCDHPKETIAPQSDNQMSGTEPPGLPPVIECRGDQCELSEPTKAPIESPEQCTAGDCSSAVDHKPDTSACGPEGCAGVKEPLTPQEPIEKQECTDEKCVPAQLPPTQSQSSAVDHKPDSSDCGPGGCAGVKEPLTPQEPIEKQECTDEKCVPAQLPPTQSQSGSPVKPCEGDDCKIFSEEKPSPQLCENENDCKKIEVPIAQTVSCEGDSCKNVDCGKDGCDSNVIIPPQDNLQAACREEDGCKPEEQTEVTPSDCTGDLPCRRKDIPGTEELPSKCEGSDCAQKPDTAVTPDVYKLSTEASITEETPLEETTDKIIPSEEEKLVQDVSTDEPISKKPEVVDKEHIDEETSSKLPYKPDSVEEPSTTISDTVEEHTDKPLSVTEEGTKGPEITEESTAKSTLVEEEGTKMPYNIQEHTDKPDLVEKEITKGPEITEGQTSKPTLIEVEVTKAPYDEKEHTDKPVMVEEEVTKLPYPIEEQTDKPALVEEEPLVPGTKDPEIIEQQTDKPELVEEQTAKPVLVEAEGTKAPYDEKRTDKPATVEEEITKAPYDTEVETDKPALVGEEPFAPGTKIPEITEEQTDKPAMVEEEGTKVPYVIEEHTDKPASIEEEGTKSPEITKEQTAEPEFVEVEGTKVPYDQERTDKPALAEEEITKSPYDTEVETDKPALVEAEPFVPSTKGPEITEERTDKPAMVEQEGTKGPEVTEEQTTKPALEEIEETKGPEVAEEQTTKPALEEVEGTKGPEVTEEQTDKPSSVEKESTKTPDDTENKTYKPDSVTEDRMSTPGAEDEHTDKPALIEDAVTKIPDITAEYTGKPAVIEEEGTVITDITEDHTDNTISVEPDVVTDTSILPEDDIKEKPILVEEDLPEKPTAVKDDSEKKPDLIDRESTSEPAISESEGTTIPQVTEDQSTKKPILIDEDSVTPTKVEDKVKPIVTDDKTEQQVPVIEEGTEEPVVVEEGQLPVLVDKEQVTSEPPEYLPQTPSYEGTRRTEGPEVHETEPVKEVTPETLVEEHTDIGTEPEKSTNKPIDEQKTTAQEDISHTVSDLKPTDGGLGEESIDVNSPTTPVSEPQSTKVTDKQTQEIVTEYLTDQEKSTKAPLPDTTSEKTSPPLREGEEDAHQTPEYVTPSQESVTGYETSKIPELIDTTETIEKITKSSESETISEEAEIYTDMPEQEPSVTKSPEVIIIEPQDGRPSETPDLTVTGEAVDETTVKVFEKDGTLGAPESHVTETILGHDESPTTPAPEISKVTGISDVVDTETQKTDLSKPHEEKTPALTNDFSEPSPKPDQPEIFTPEKEEMITSTATPAVTEGIKESTDIEDSLVTGKDDTATTKYYETTERLEQTATENSDESSQIPISSSETPIISETATAKGAEESDTESHEAFTEAPVLRETKPTEFDVSAITESYELPQNTPESGKPMIDDQDKSTKVSETETRAPDTSDSLATGLPVTIVTESQEKPVEDIASAEEKSTATPDLNKPSVTEIYVPGEQTATEISETQATETVQPEKPIPTEPEIDISKTPLPDITEKPEDTETQSPELVSPPSHDTDIKVQPEEDQKSSTEYATTFDEIRTELPHAQASTEPSMSLITEIRPDVNMDKESVTEKQDAEPTAHEVQTESHEQITEKPDEAVVLPEVTTSKSIGEITKPADQTSAQVEFSETTPYLIELEEHTHKIVEDIPMSSPSDMEITTPPFAEEEHTSKTEDHTSTESPSVDFTHKAPEDTSAVSPIIDELTTAQPELSSSEAASEKVPEEQTETTTKQSEIPSEPSSESSTSAVPVDYQPTVSVPEEVSEKLPESSTPTESAQAEKTTGLPPVHDKYDIDQKDVTTSKSPQDSEITTPGVVVETEKSPISEPDIAIPTDKEPSATEKPMQATEPSRRTTVPEEEIILSTTEAVPIKEEEASTPVTEDKYGKPDEKPTSEVAPPTPASDLPKPPSELQPTDETTPDEDGHFPSSGYGEPDYVEEDQAFGPGTCRYGGKVYVSAQQIPRDDPCDFCFCFRSDIICLQQSCPPPIHGCHEEPIQGFCCPRYECPVSMATTVNVTTTTTTTTTTLPPHFPTHSYKGAAQRRGCQIKGHTYKVGEVVRSSSGPCLHCTCGGDGQMKCDPKACTPEPMLRQMIAAAVSAKRRR